MQSLRPFALGLLVFALVALSQGLPVDNQAERSVESVLKPVVNEQVAQESLDRKKRESWEYKKSTHHESNTGISFGLGTGFQIDVGGESKTRYETKHTLNDGTVVSHGREYGHAHGGSYNPWSNNNEHTTRSWADIW